jgi:hypothetical protein
VRYGFHAFGVAMFIFAWVALRMVLLADRCRETTPLLYIFLRCSAFASVAFSGPCVSV